MTPVKGNDLTEVMDNVVLKYRTGPIEYTVETETSILIRILL